MKALVDVSHFQGLSKDSDVCSRPVYRQACVGVSDGRAEHVDSSRDGYVVPVRFRHGSIRQFRHVSRAPCPRRRAASLHSCLKMKALVEVSHFQRLSRDSGAYSRPVSRPACVGVSDRRAHEQLPALRP